MPYEFEATSSMIQQVWARPSTVAELKLEQTFSMLVDTHHATIWNFSSVHPIDIGLDTILYLLQANPDCLDPGFFRSLVVYVGERKKTKGIYARMFARCDPRFVGSFLTKSLGISRGLLTDSSLFSIWAACCGEGASFATFDEETLAAVSTAQQFFLSACTAAVLKAHIATRAAIQLAGGLADSLHGPPLSLAVLDTAEQWWTDWFAVLVEFLESRDAFRVLSPSHAPMEVETFEALIRSRPVDGDSRSESLQRRFADSFLNIINRDSVQTHAKLIGGVVRWLAWNFGAPAIQGFDDPDARETMRKALIKCSEALSDGKLELASPWVGQWMEGVIVQLASHTSHLEAPSTKVIAEGTGMPEAVTPGEGAMPHTV
jgi:hypothetical protein